MNHEKERMTTAAQIIEDLEARCRKLAEAAMEDEAQIEALEAEHDELRNVIRHAVNDLDGSVRGVIPKQALERLRRIADQGEQT